MTLRCAPSTQTPIRYAATAVNPPPPVPAAAARSPLAPSVLQSHPFGGHDQFTHWRSAAEDNLNSTLAESTRAEGNSSWRRYDSSLGRISGLIDPLFQTIRTLGTTQNNLRRVAATLREGRLDTGLAATNRDRTCPELLIVLTTQDGVAQAYRPTQFGSRIHGQRKQLEHVPTLQLRSYADKIRNETTASAASRGVSAS